MITIATRALRPTKTPDFLILGIFGALALIVAGWLAGWTLYRAFGGEVLLNVAGFAALILAARLLDNRARRHTSPTR